MNIFSIFLLFLGFVFHFQLKMLNECFSLYLRFSFIFRVCFGCVSIFFFILYLWAPFSLWPAAIAILFHCACRCTCLITSKIPRKRWQKKQPANELKTTTKKTLPDCLCYLLYAYINFISLVFEVSARLIGIYDAIFSGAPTKRKRNRWFLSLAPVK